MSKASDAARVILHHFTGDAGLIDALRPYSGAIDPAALEDTLSAVRTIKNEAAHGETIPVSTLAGIFLLTNTVRTWALDSDSMLVRNNRIEPAEWSRLMKWVTEVEHEFRSLLGILEGREGLNAT